MLINNTTPSQLSMPCQVCYLPSCLFMLINNSIPSQLPMSCPACHPSSCLFMIINNTTPSQLPMPYPACILSSWETYAQVRHMWDFFLYIRLRTIFSYIKSHSSHIYIYDSHTYVSVCVSVMTCMYRRVY